MGAEGPSFSGLLAQPVARAAFCDFDVKDELPPPVFIAPDESSARDIVFAKPRRRMAFHPIEYAARVWRSAPVFVRGIAISAPLVFTGLFFGPKLEIPETKPSTTWTSFTSAAHARAAVDLREDFRNGADGWIVKPGKGSAWAFDGEGSARPGRLAIFKDTIPLRNYRFEFQGQIDAKALGFAFRAADTNNYQAAKLVVVKAGAVPTLALAHYTVIAGKAGPKTQIPVPIDDARRDTIYKLLVDVQGDNFSVTVNGQLVAAWSDSRFKSGGVGFFADKGEQARLRSLHVIDNQDFLGWLCSQVSWWTADRQKSGATHE